MVGVETIFSFSVFPCANGIVKVAEQSKIEASAVNSYVGPPLPGAFVKGNTLSTTGIVRSYFCVLDIVRMRNTSKVRHSIIGPVAIDMIDLIVRE